MTKVAQKPYRLGLHKPTIYSPHKGVPPAPPPRAFFFYLLLNTITYIALLYLQHDTILNLLTIHYIIVIIIMIIVVIIIIIIIIIIISNAFTVLQTSLIIRKKPIYNTWHYLTYLQYAIITYYDLHITLLNELQYNTRGLLLLNKIDDNPPVIIVINHLFVTRIHWLEKLNK